MMGLFGVAPEPWPPLSGGAFTGQPQPSSPDPLVAYQFNAGTNDTTLQIFSVAAVSVGGTPSTSFTNTNSAVGSVRCSIGVEGGGTLLIDFGVELPAWLEFDSSDLLLVDATLISMGISEYNVLGYLGDYKKSQPTVYCGGGVDLSDSLCTYRLETNSDLYEGVRYGFLTLPRAPSRNFTITGLRAVSQAKPVNYTGSFSSPGDPILERIWYTAAYTVRATLQTNYMGSILMDRGDRFSWAGDAHPTQATAMAAFGSFDIVFQNLDRSKGDCQGIATYCLYFVLSVSDYYWATNNKSAVEYLTKSITDNLEKSLEMWDNPESLRFIGWDDRTGSGFANNTNPETQNIYRLLSIRTLSAAAALFNATGATSLAYHYAAAAANCTKKIRTMGGGGGGGGGSASARPWYSSFGLHASADAVNAGFLSAEEQAGIAAGPLGDIVKLPSQSNFNQYFILQALSGLGQLDRAIESIRVVWGPIIELGATTCVID